MARHKILLLIGITEILIGCTTLTATTISLILFTNIKTLNVLLFVLITASVSTLLGVGILNLRKIAHNLLIYFSSVIVLSKFLIFTDIIQFNGALETTIPDPLKNCISVIYHIFVITYLSRPSIKKLFVK